MTRYIPGITSSVMPGCSFVVKAMTERSSEWSNQQRPVQIIVFNLWAMLGERPRLRAIQNYPSRSVRCVICIDVSERKSQSTRFASAPPSRLPPPLFLLERASSEPLTEHENHHVPPLKARLSPGFPIHAPTSAVIRLAKPRLCSPRARRFQSIAPPCARETRASPPHARDHRLRFAFVRFVRSRRRFRVLRAPKRRFHAVVPEGVGVTVPNSTRARRSARACARSRIATAARARGRLCARRARAS